MEIVKKLLQEITVMPRPNSVVTPKSAIAKDWKDPRKLANVCNYFRSPCLSYGPINPIDENILSCVGKEGSCMSLTQIMRQLEQFYSPVSLKKLICLGYIKVEVGDGDLILVRTDKPC